MYIDILGLSCVNMFPTDLVIWHFERMNWIPHGNPQCNISHHQLDLLSQIVFFWIFVFCFVYQNFWHFFFLFLSDYLFQDYTNTSTHPFRSPAGSWEILKSRGHCITPTDGRKVTPCVYCSINLVRSKTGRKTYTRNKCSLCNVPLCTKNRDCFNLFHKSVLENL